MSDPNIPVKCYFASKALCQAECDRVHAWCLANIPAYAADVALFNAGGPGGTARWCFPQQDADNPNAPFGTPITYSGPWYCTYVNRCLPGCAVQMNSAVAWTEKAVLQADMSPILTAGNVPTDMSVLNPGS